MPQEKSDKYIPEALESKIDVDFDALLKELDFLRETPQLDEGEVQNFVRKFHENFENAELAQERERDILWRIVKRMEAECGDIGSFNFLSEAIDLIDINRSTDEFIIHKNVTEDEFAAYDFNKGKIVLTQTAISMMAPAILLQNLAVFGFSKSVSALHHELLHSKQYRSNEEENKIIKDLTETFSFYSAITNIKHLIVPYTRGHNILKEVHAYRGENRFAEHYSKTIDLIEALKGKEYGYKKPKDIDRIIIASQDIKRLYTLGLSDDEIADLVKRAKWDKKRICYDVIEDRVKELTEQKGLDEEDVDNLVLADDIKRKIYIQKVKLIAQDELKKAVENL